MMANPNVVSHLHAKWISKFPAINLNQTNQSGTIQEEECWSKQRLTAMNSLCQERKTIPAR